MDLHPIAENAILVSNDKIFEDLVKLRSDFYFENWTKSNENN